jgi:hypothetical protein
VDLLLDRVAGKTGPGVLKKLQPELRVRESCGWTVAAEQGKSRE